MSFTAGNITALVVAASFAAGLNIYATVLTLGILARTQWVSLPPGLESLGHTWVLVVCGIMFAIEFVADKIPGFDMIWNALHTIVRVPIAGLVAYHASSQLSPQMQIMATGIGAGIALATHGSKTAVRAAVTPSPEPVSNIALSTTEDVIAVGLTWFATHHPIIAASAALILLTSGIVVARALLRAIQRPLRRIFRPDLERAEATRKPSV
ncbi:MAG: putative transrane protein [Edaphobacter sp.]|nr:putative transrane protein [Edaphobacter sp.]